LPPGSLTALTGPNGAGKSTAVAVLLGLTAPDAGRVVIRPPGASAPIALGDVDPASWWRQLAWAPQRPVLLPGTVLQNLLEVYDREPQPTPEVEAAARAAGFDSVVESLDGGWDARIGQGGVGLSVGQRQRLALARAFYRDTPLVILDEPTAHLDAATEQAVLESITRLHAAGKTVLLVAHRPALLSQAHTAVPVHSTALAEAAP
jgi:ATP-binding cassette subfamily C protein CydD